MMERIHKPKYRQPHSIKSPVWMNEALAEKFKERVHHYEKYNARYTQTFINKESYRLIGGIKNE